MFQKKTGKLKEYYKRSRLDQVLWFVENYLPQKDKRATRKELQLDSIEVATINQIQKLLSVRSKSLNPTITHTKVSFTIGNWALPYLNLLFTSTLLTPTITNKKVSFTMGNWALPYLNLLKQIGFLK